MATPESAPSMLVLPIFPLPEVALFPHTAMPLHVFEARYRAMVADALARDRRLAVVRLLPGYEATYAGKPPVAAVAGAGEIVSCERLPGGRYNILVEARWRIRIEQEVPTDTLYRLARARRLVESPADVEAPPLVARVREACARLLETLDRPRDLLESLLADAQPPGVIADRAAAAFLPDVGLRQELLETLDVTERLRRLSVSLDALVNELRGGRGGAS